MKNSFIFYRSYYDAICNLEENQQGRLFKIIANYALNQELPTFKSPIEKTIFTLIKPNIDAGITRFENGKKGGRPKTKTKPNQNLNETKTKPNQNLTYQDIYQEQELEQDKDIEQDIDIKTEQDNTSYGVSCQNNIDEKKSTYTTLICKINDLADKDIIDIQSANRLIACANYIYLQDYMKLRGQNIPTAKIFNTLQNIFRAQDDIVSERVAIILYQIDNPKEKIHNKEKYLVSVWYNKAMESQIE